MMQVENAVVSIEHDETWQNFADWRVEYTIDIHQPDVIYEEIASSAWRALQGALSHGWLQVGRPYVAEVHDAMRNQLTLTVSVRMRRLG